MGDTGTERPVARRARPASAEASPPPLPLIFGVEAGLRGELLTEPEAAREPRGTRTEGSGRAESDDAGRRGLRIGVSSPEPGGPVPPPGGGLGRGLRGAAPRADGRRGDRASRAPPLVLLLRSELAFPSRPGNNTSK